MNTKHRKYLKFYKRRLMVCSLMNSALKKGTDEDDLSVPFLTKDDLLRDRASSTTH